MTIDELLNTIYQKWNTLSNDEKINLLCQASSFHDECNEYLKNIKTEYRNLNNKYELRKIYNAYPNDKLWDSYSAEAWNVNETVKKVITRFQEFFKKVFEYINSFVVLRITVSTNAVNKWYEIVADKKHDQTKIDKLFKDTDAKACTVDDIYKLINSIQIVYLKLSDQINKVKAFKTLNTDSSEQLTELFTFPKEYDTYVELYKTAESKQPTKEDPAASKGVDYVTGGWGNANKLNALKSSFEHLSQALLNLKRLQKICNDIVDDLNKTDASDHAKQINDEKIKYLKNFSENILSKMMGAIIKYTSLAGKICQQFTKNYNTK